VHDLMLLEADEGWEDFEADIADLSGSGRVLVLVVLQTVLAFEFLAALWGDQES
jgi:hypothetical protein